MSNQNFSDKVFSFTQENALFSAPCHLLVGVSGGADSVALLHLLANWRQPGLSLTAVHIHHGLRAETADRDMTFVESLCRRLGVAFVGQYADVMQVAAANAIGLEEAGRRERYRIFEELRQNIGADYVLTAHTASDQAETVLMHLLRGCGTDGLTGIPARRGSILRPLLTCTRAEVESYCAEQELEYVTDETNADLRYTRNRMRHQLLPSLRKENPAVDEALCRLAQHTGEDSRYLWSLAMEALNEAVHPEGGYRCGAFVNEPIPIRRRMIRGILNRLELPQVSESHVLAIERLLAQGTGETVLPLGMVLRAEAGRLFPVSSQTVYSTQPLLVDQLPFSGDFAEKSFALSVKDTEKFADWKNVHKMFFKSSVDYDRIQGGLCVRSRLSGDTLHPAGRGVGKTLKKLINEWEIPPSQRDGLPLLCDEQGVVLIPGYTCDERVRVTADTKHFLVWESTSVQG